MTAIQMMFVYGILGALITNSYFNSKDLKSIKEKIDRISERMDK